MNQYDMLVEARNAILKKFPQMPKYVVTLGSGLSSLLNEIQVEGELPFSEIPHLRKATVKEHVGKFIVGTWHGVRVGCMRGRLHFYEGYSMQEVVFPFRALAFAGAQVFFLTNASGGMKEGMSPMDLMLVRDHINLMGSNPLVGENDERLGVRFPDTTTLYDPKCNDIIRDTAKKLGVNLREGIYVGVHGPSFETPAEILFYRQVGGDVVGMSTVPEAIALRHMGKTVCAISCVTNLASGIAKGPINHDEIVDTAVRVYPSFANVIGHSIKRMETEL